MSADTAKRGWSAETWMWIFVRISGLVLLVLALLHFAITHIINDVVETDAAFVERRWSNPAWRIYDWALLALALAHGVIGLRTIMDDYIRSATRRALTKGVVYSATTALLIYGTVTIVTF